MLRRRQKYLMYSTFKGRLGIRRPNRQILVVILEAEDVKNEQCHRRDSNLGPPEYSLSLSMEAC
ncbi:hypothetical protein X975_09795, partial [Stegodyphus mimosarum]